MHCLAGISRSATLVIAYVIRLQGVSFRVAYDFVKSCRPSIEPNFNFIDQLMNYDLRYSKKNGDKSFGENDKINDQALYLPKFQKESVLSSNVLNKSIPPCLSLSIENRKRSFNEIRPNKINYAKKIAHLPTPFLINIYRKKETLSPSAEFSKLDIFCSDGNNSSKLQKTRSNVSVEFSKSEIQNVLQSNSYEDITLHNNQLKNTFMEDNPESGFFDDDDEADLTDNDDNTKKNEISEDDNNNSSVKFFESSNQAENVDSSGLPSSALRHTSSTSSLEITVQ